MSFQVSEIRARHNLFLNTYFDRILDRLKSILNDFINEVENLEKIIAKNDFTTVLNVASLHFESIFVSDYIYDKESLIKIYNRRREHSRYQSVIDKFYKDLSSHIIETKSYFQEIFEPKKEIYNQLTEEPLYNIVFISADNAHPNIKKETKTSFYYELGKLATKRNARDFDFFSRLLKLKCSENKLVMNELDHMEANIYNEIEYYSAYRLICLELKEV